MVHLADAHAAGLDAQTEGSVIEAVLDRSERADRFRFARLVELQVRRAVERGRRRLDLPHPFVEALRAKAAEPEVHARETGPAIMPREAGELALRVHHGLELALHAR